MSEIDSNAIDKFEIYLVEPSIVYFELFECAGNITVKGS